MVIGGELFRGLEGRLSDIDWSETGAGGSGSGIGIQGETATPLGLPIEIA